jgi:hypothetical protein
MTQNRISLIQRHIKGQHVGKGHALYVTMHVPLDQSEIDDIMHGAVRIYSYSWAQWAGAQREIEQCLWLQPPATNDLTNSKLVWHICEQ